MKQPNLFVATQPVESIVTALELPRSAAAV